MPQSSHSAGVACPTDHACAPRADGVEDLLASSLAQHLGIAQPGRHGAQLDPRDARPPHRRSAARPTSRARPRRAPPPIRSPRSAGGAPASGRASRPSRGHRRVRLSYHGAVSHDGGEAPDPHARVPADPGDESRRSQPLSRDMGARASRSPRSTQDGYRIRRMSDGSTLGELFTRDDVRRERTRQGFWWH